MVVVQLVTGFTALGVWLIVVAALGGWLVIAQSVQLIEALGVWLMVIAHGCGSQSQLTVVACWRS